MTAYIGRHRMESTSSKTATKNIAKAAVAGAALGTAGFVFSPVANAAPDSDWDRLAQCESGGNWSINTGNGFHGGLQFHPQTWAGYGGTQFAPTANQATREQQIYVAEKVLAGQGWGAWPACSQRLGLNSAPTDRPTPGTGAPRAAAAPVSTEPSSPSAADHVAALQELADQVYAGAPITETYEANQELVDGLYAENEDLVDDFFAELLPR